VNLRSSAFLALARTRKLAPYLLHSYDYMYSPAQLAFLLEQLDATENVPGAVLEVGCALGATTVFLNRHLNGSREYFALDTFGGFTAEDVQAEHRRGRLNSFANFRRNSRATFERTMKLNGARVTAIEADAKTFDYSPLAPLSFVLVDVDLYQPVLATLNAVWDLMSPGGVIVVDDCDREHPMWAGGWEAYSEFVSSLGVPVDVRLTKLGLIQR
jgi:O-methyltransferase